MSNAAANAVKTRELFGMERVKQPDAEEAAKDRELLKCCQLGDEEAFDELVLRHHSRAFHVAFRILRNHEDATEVAQDAFVKVYRNLNGFRGECEFTTWLHQIVVNLAHNKNRWWKRRGRHAAVSLDATVDTADGEVPRQVAADIDAPDVQSAQAEFVELLGRKVDELPKKFREVLVLRNVENLSYEEIAVVLDCSIGTVKSRIARARDALRESLKDEV
ncbi:MAG TPA: sigma-70 family RNA polymerase sigma factor [Verrucomicrobiae bacterium]|nr:sigma-70 family RNA polymerase sigma factor [Verrucomicrobiae bacterium]